MPTFHHGKATHFSLDDTGGTSRDISDVLNSVDFPEVIETAETTAFEAILTNYSVSSPVGDVVTFSLDLQCTGGVTRTTF